MVAVDLHKYWNALPPPTGALIPVWPHAAVAQFSQMAAKGYLRTGSITAHTQLMIAGGFDVGPVLPHMPYLVPPPHPVAEPPILALIVATSTSTAQLTVGSVTGEGNALAVCISSSYGLNVNCCDPRDLPLGNVIVVSSVQTNPTVGDYAAAFAGWAISMHINFKIGQFLDRFKNLARKAIAVIKTIVRAYQDFLKWVFPKFADIIDPSGTVAGKVKQFVDWMDHVVDDAWGRITP
jgi:hypothetical protein